MKITKKDTEKEPFLRQFFVGAEKEHKLSKEEIEEIKGIRERFNSPVLRCRATEDRPGRWKKGDIVGVREVDLTNDLEIIK
jgi:hypothetical protein